MQCFSLQKKKIPFLTNLTHSRLHIGITVIDSHQLSNEERLGPQLVWMVRDRKDDPMPT